MVWKNQRSCLKRKIRNYWKEFVLSRKNRYKCSQDPSHSDIRKREVSKKFLCLIECLLVNDHRLSAQKHCEKY